jgi:hypothetical protein
MQRILERMRFQSLTHHSLYPAFLKVFQLWIEQTWDQTCGSIDGKNSLLRIGNICTAASNQIIFIGIRIYGSS